MSEIINYTPAAKMAAIFHANTQAIKTHLEAVKALTDQLDATFGNRGYGFAIQLGFSGRDRSEIDSILRLMKLSAWRLIVEHTGIRKVMSAKRQAALDNALGSSDPKMADTLPDITEDTIFGVLAGFTESAADFLNEAIDEVYDWIKPGSKSRFATNQKSVDSARLELKVILTHVLDGPAWKSDGWNVGYRSRPYLMALDNVFHLLDGAGPLTGHRGPLIDAIGLAKSGKTKYFRFKCYGNLNLHLEFTRYDLLRKFNEICGRNRLGNQPSQQSSSNGLFELMRR